MIIGTGMIAKAFSSYENNNDIIVFAKGVSNSQETNKANFDRESNALKEALANHKTKTIIYFGTCSINDPDNKDSFYVKHKLQMEELIKNSELKYYIFRLPQVVGTTNSPTLIKYLSTKIRENSEFNIWKHSKRNLIDIEDVYKVVDYLISHKYLKNNITNIASRNSTSIITIVQRIEKAMNKKARYTLMDVGSSYEIDISNVEKYFDTVGVHFDKNYLDNILTKYIK